MDDSTGPRVSLRTGLLPGDGDFPISRGISIIVLLSLAKANPLHNWTFGILLFQERSKKLLPCVSCASLKVLVNQNLAKPTKEI